MECSFLSASPRSLKAAAVLAWGALVGVPLLMLTYYSLSGGSELYSSLSPVLFRRLHATAIQAGVSTGISLALGLVWAALLVSQKRGEGMVRAFLTLPNAIPPLAVAWVFIELLPEMAYSWRAVILAQVWFNAPWVAGRVIEALREIPQAEWEVAQSLGSSVTSRLRWVVSPRVWPAALGAATQSFAWCAMSFSLVLLLGGGPPVQTLETEIAARLQTSLLNLSSAATFAGAQLLLNLFPWLLLLFLTRKQKPAGHGKKWRPEGGAWVSWGGSFLAVAWSIPLLGWVIREVSYGFGDFSEWAPALWASVQLAGAASVASVVWAWAVVWSFRSRWSLALVSISGGMSALVLGVGVLLSGGSWLGIQSPFWLLLWVQAALFFPILLKWFLPLREKSPQALHEAALAMGAGFWKRQLWLELPRWRAPILAASAWVFAASLGEVAAVSLFANETFSPLPRVLAQWMSQYRFQEASAGMGFLILLSGLAFVGMVWAQPREQRES